MFFYAIWSWGLRMVVCGFWGLFCFGLPGPAFLLWGWVGPGLVFWTVVLTVALAWLHVLLCGAWLGFCWFCLESLILAQDERWRRA